MAEQRKCANDACSCVVEEKTKYCSEHCEDAVEQDIIEIKCDCGHAACEL